MRVYALVLILGIAILLACCTDRDAAAPVGHGRVREAITSNVRFEDYAGSRSCAGCHAAVAEKFAHSPMHRMTRDAASAEIRAPFSGESFEFRGDRAKMFRVGDRRYVELTTRREGRQLFRVTEVIGGHYREDFAGLEVKDTGARLRPVYRDPRRQVLPVTWVLRTREWRYKGYSVQLPERSRLVAGPTWERTCVFCHNTVPYLTTVFDDLAGIERPPYQGSVPSNLLPKDRRLEFRVLSADRVGSAVRAELSRIGVDPDAELPRAAGRLRPEDGELQRLLRAGVYGTWKHFERDHLVEVGIGCESCHGGGREHAEDPQRRPSFAPKSPGFSVERGGRPVAGVLAQNHVCARCHSVLFTGYEHTWEGGARKSRPGGSTINSGEARDFLLGHCAEQLACTSCHDPHAADDKKALAKLATPEGNDVCTTCHQQFADDAALARHSHHPVSSAGASCVGCHMPKKNIGLDYGLTRYHRIGSPNDPERVLRDRPLECALCHPRDSVERLVSTMERWWGKRYDRRRLVELYGEDLSVGALEATLLRGLPHERTVAMDRLSQQRDPRFADAFVTELGNELPLTRYFAREALARLYGQRPALDMSVPGAELRRAGADWVARQRQAR